MKKYTSLLLCAALGLFLLVLAVWQGKNSYFEFTKGVKTQAQLITINEISRRRPAGYREFIVQFNTQNGEQIETSLKDTPNNPTVGQMFTVYYHPDDPSTVWIRNMWQQWFAPAILGILGVFLIFIAYILKDVDF